MFRKTLHLTFAVVVTLASASITDAQTRTGSFSVNGNFGASLPVGKMDNRPFDGGINASTGHEVGFAIHAETGSSLVLSADVRYVAMSVDAGFFFLDATAHSYLFGLSGIYYPGSPVSETQPFLIAGVMGGKPRVTADKDFRDAVMEVEFAVGVHGGAGVMQMVSQSVGITAALELNHMATDGAKVTTVNNGQNVNTSELSLNMQWVSVRFGVTKKFGG
ncbi:MAG: hypothetical protein ABL962_16150 [Fimbriimonadaceae bacterium]